MNRNVLIFGGVALLFMLLRKTATPAPVPAIVPKSQILRDRMQGTISPPVASAYGIRGQVVAERFTEGG